MRTALYVPLRAARRAIGVIVAVRQARSGQALLERATSGSRRRSPHARRSRSTCRSADRSATPRRVVEAQELERRRLARELHDETGQALTSILLGLRALEELDGLAALGEAVAALRELVVADAAGRAPARGRASPDGARRLRARAALERLDGDVRRADRDEGRARVPPRRERLPAEVETALYRIVQEALTNIVKHARRRTGRASSSRGRRARSRAVIEDDGRGFDPAQARDGRHRPHRHARARRSARTGR